MKVKARNLLDHQVRVTRGRVLEREYNTGRSVTIGLDYSF